MSSEPLTEDEIKRIRDLMMADRHTFPIAHDERFELTIENCAQGVRFIFEIAGNPNEDGWIHVDAKFQLIALTAEVRTRLNEKTEGN